MTNTARAIDDGPETVDMNDMTDAEGEYVHGTQMDLSGGRYVWAGQDKDGNVCVRLHNGKAGGEMGFKLTLEAAAALRTLLPSVERTIYRYVMEASRDAEDAIWLNLKEILPTKTKAAE